MDVDAIEPGIPFDEAIKRALDQCEHHFQGDTSTFFY
jgi:hypothetical protein